MDCAVTVKSDYVRGVWALLAATAIILVGCDSGFNDAATGQTAGITVDGDPSDWSGKPVTIDATGDMTSSLSGADITSIHVATDSAKLYLRIDLANGYPSDALTYNIFFEQQQYNQTAGDCYLVLNIRYIQNCTVYQYTGAGDGLFKGSAECAIQAGTIEIAVDLEHLGQVDGRSLYVSNQAGNYTEPIDTSDSVLLSL